MRSMHGIVLHLEKQLLKTKSAAHLLFVVHVPKRMNFVAAPPGDMFFLRFEDIFIMFLLKQLEHTIGRLVALSMAA
jgi:hypothetical protein